MLHKAVVALQACEVLQLLDKNGRGIGEGAGAPIWVSSVSAVLVGKLLLSNVTFLDK